MAEKLTLTTPESGPTTTEWEVVDFFMSKEGPSIKVTLKGNNGERYVYRAVVNATTTPAEIMAGLSFINQGKFMTLQGKSLQRWLLDRISLEGIKPGTVSGTPD